MTFVPATVGALFAGVTTAGIGESWTLQPTAASQHYLPPPGFQAWDGGPVTPPATSVWSASDAAANAMTLSNGGLTVTQTTANGSRSIRTSTSHASSKVYVEFLCNSTTNGTYGLWGVGSSGFDPSSYFGTSSYSCGIYIGNQTFVSSGFTANNAITAGVHNNDVWALAVDFSAGSIWIAQNNVWWNSGNPATGSLPMASFVPATVGALFAGLSLNAGVSVDVWTLQPTAASQKYAPPSGFTPWG